MLGPAEEVRGYACGRAMLVTAIPHETYGALFLRFLRFGALAWGGPVAQIAMIQRELVEEERWISSERFNRALAVYQALPGPEAHELCVYFGMLARGRIGGLLAGLGFMLPGFVLMLLLSWLYVASQGALASDGRPVFAALQAAVLALILRAVHRIGSHAVRDRRLLATAVASLAGSLAGVHFAINLGLAGTSYLLLRKKQRAAAAITAGIFLPAFGFTLIAHDALERITQSERLRHLLDGMTAGVVGLIAATTVELAPAALGTIGAGAVFAGALALLYLVGHKLNVLLVIGCAAVAGWLFF